MQTDKAQNGPLLRQIVIVVLFTVMWPAAAQPAAFNLTAGQPLNSGLYMPLHGFTTRPGYGRALDHTVGQIHRTLFVGLRATIIAALSKPAQTVTDSANAVMVRPCNHMMHHTLADPS